MSWRRRLDGLSPREARRRALAAFGGVDAIKEMARDQWTRRVVDQAVRETRYAVRVLWRAPGFAALAVLTMALGIGATTATWSVIDGVLLRPLPFPTSERLIEVWNWHSHGGGPFVTVDTLETLRDTATSLDAIEGHVTAQVVAGGEQPRTLEVARVTAGLLPALGVPPVRGRYLAAGEPWDAVVLREDLWRQIGAADPTSVGGSVVIDGRPYLVVGVMPSTFHFPTAETQAWVPLGWDPETPVTGADVVRTLGRRRSGVSLDQAGRQLATISRGLREQGALRDADTLVPRPLHPFEPGPRLTGDLPQFGLSAPEARIRSTLYLLFGAVVFVLLIACANTANLMLARAARRARETAVRQALGASLLRVGRQFVTETLLLGGVAGVLGAGLAVAAVRVIASMMPPLEFQDVSGAAVSPRALLVVIGLSLATGLLVGLVPALRASRGSVAASLAAIGRTTSGPRRRLSGALVVAEIALSLMLLAGAGLLVRSFVNLQRMEAGFDVDRLVVVDPRLPAVRYADGEARFRFLDELSTRVQRLPGVRAVALAGSAPPDTAFVSFGQMQLDAADGPRSLPDAVVPWNRVSPGYFDTLGIPLLEGRAFTRRDDAAADQVAIVSATTARRWWPDRSAVGQRFRWERIEGEQWRTVVGVAGDIRQTDPDWQSGEAQYYVPFPPDRVGRFVRFVVRTDTPETLLSAIRQEAWAIDPRVALVASTMDQLVRDVQARPRFAAWLMTVFAMVGILLAAGGIFAVVSYDVSQRTLEVGIRMALGATRPDILRLVLGRGVALIAGGAAIGLAGAAAVTRLAGSLLFEVAPLDPPAFIGATVVLIGVALLATCLPARRATGVEPVAALRAE